MDYNNDKKEKETEREYGNVEDVRRWGEEQERDGIAAQQVMDGKPQIHGQCTQGFLEVPEPGNPCSTTLVEYSIIQLRFPGEGEGCPA